MTCPKISRRRSGSLPEVLMRANARRIVALTIVMGLTGAGLAQTIKLPNLPDSVKFAVLGDFGNGERAQYEVGEQMSAARAAFPFDMVLALGDNMYGRQQPQDFVVKFDQPYARLLAAGVRFYATLGNHDRPDNRNYPAYNMAGRRYYSFVRSAVRFVVLDTNMMEPQQLAWADQTLAAATEPWKIVYFHHPLYSNGGRHGSNIELRVALEPLLVKHGVSVVFTGHEHIYERSKPQKGITYFVAGSGGQLRRGDAHIGATTAAAFDQDRAFMLVEIAAESMVFQTISRTGAIVDSGVIARRRIS
jgi:3',5'-cyclic AMP phosphodiesterase CpdA